MQTQTQQAINPSDYHEAVDIINDSYRLAAQTVALLRSCSFEIIQFGMPEEYRTQEFIDACWQLEVAQEKAEATLSKLAEWEWERKPKSQEGAQAVQATTELN